MDCIFCAISEGKIPASKVYEDDLILAFLDIAPQAPVHIVVIPKAHIASSDGINVENSAQIARIFELVPKIARDAGCKNGYRVITNCGPDARQTVSHLHFHILGGVRLPDRLA